MTPGGVTFYIIWLAIKTASDTQNRHQENFTCVAVQSTGDKGTQESHTRLPAEFYKINIHVLLNCAEIKNSKTRTGYFSFKENSPLSDTITSAVTTRDITSGFDFRSRETSSV